MQDLLEGAEGKLPPSLPIAFGRAHCCRSCCGKACCDCRCVQSKQWRPVKLGGGGFPSCRPRDASDHVLLAPIASLQPSPPPRSQLNGTSLILPTHEAAVPAPFMPDPFSLLVTLTPFFPPPDTRPPRSPPRPPPLPFY